MSSPARFSGRAALVTGAGSAIGAAIAMRLAGEGAAVALAVRSDQARAEAVAARINGEGGRAITLVGDICSRGAVDAMIDDTVAAFGGVDILVNNAGASARAPLDQVSEADWDHVFAVNCKGTLLCSVAAARQMAVRRAGAIVNIAGASAHRSFPGAGAYGPSKAAVVNLTVQMALEWAERGIRVNCVSPGPIRPADSDWQNSEPRLAREAQRIPLRRVGSPEDVASAVSYLASDEASNVTGHALVVDGGGIATWYLA
jgi:NAD(P)-dependent dehydrogenase (short-subunit alcohol dehydrogenase family)